MNDYPRGRYSAKVRKIGTLPPAQLLDCAMQRTVRCPNRCCYATDA